jgi:hypothetical protein
MEAPAAWLERLPSLSPAPNRIAVRVRAPASRRWQLVGTLALDGSPADMLADVQQVLDHHDGEIESVVMEAWCAGAKSPCDRLPFPTIDQDTDARHEGQTPQATAIDHLVQLVREQRAYIRELHAASATMQQHVPAFSQSVLDKVIQIATTVEKDRDRWEHLALALIEHGDTDGSSSAKDRLRTLAREDLHHAGRALMHAAVAKLAGGKGQPLAAPLLDGLRSFTASLQDRQLDQIRRILSPEQATALLAVLAAAEGDPDPLDAEADPVDEQPPA